MARTWDECAETLPIVTSWRITAHIASNFLDPVVGQCDYTSRPVLHNSHNVLDYGYSRHYALCTVAATQGKSAIRRQELGLCYVNDAWVPSGSGGQL
jgi:hypothetical protein